MKKLVVTKDAPAAIGPYSQAIDAGGFVFLSGQIPLDPATGKMVEGDIKAQVRQALTNIRAVLQSAGVDLADVVKVSVFLANIADGKAMNEVYAEFFPADPPARTTVGASLPAGAGVEIDVVAVRPG